MTGTPVHVMVLTKAVTNSTVNTNHLKQEELGSSDDKNNSHGNICSHDVSGLIQLDLFHAGFL